MKTLLNLVILCFLAVAAGTAIGGDKSKALTINSKYKVVSQENTLIVSPTDSMATINPSVADSCTTVCAGGTLFCVCEDEDGNGYSYPCGSCKAVRPMIEHWIKGESVLSIPVPGDIDPLPMRHTKPNFLK